VTQLIQNSSAGFGPREKGDRVRDGLVEDLGICLVKERGGCVRGRGDMIPKLPHIKKNKRKWLRGQGRQSGHDILVNQNDHY